MKPTAWHYQGELWIDHVLRDWVYQEYIEEISGHRRREGPLELDSMSYKECQAKRLAQLQI